MLAGLSNLLKLLVLLWLMPAVVHAQQVLPIFDAHSHFKTADSKVFQPEEIVALLDSHHIERMVIVGEPAERAMRLYRFAPRRFVPFLGLYLGYQEKGSWMFDTELPDRLRGKLQQEHYAGIGEVHLFAAQKDNPVFRKIVALADEFNLPLLLHGDAQVVEQAFDWYPEITIIWAHLGTIPEPQIIHQMLKQFPERLYVDTSVRDERFETEGKLLSQWRELFIEHQDRMLVGIDTYSLQRWQDMDEVTSRIRHWLSQLPEKVARKIAYQNARQLFATAAQQ